MLAQTLRPSPGLPRQKGQGYRGNADGSPLTYSINLQHEKFTAEGEPTAEGENK